MSKVFMPIKDFEDIFAWQKAHELVLMTYKLTKKYPKDELFGLVSQSRRCAVSVPSNIVEGFKRFGLQDDMRFTNIVQASLEELKYQMLLAKDLNYISENEYSNFYKLAKDLTHLIYLWVKSKPSKKLS